VSCAHDGLFLSNVATGTIGVLNNDLQVEHKFSGIKFEDVKHTKSLILSQLGNKVEVWELGGSLKETHEWKLADIVTNIHSPGFFNKIEGVYYYYEVSNVEESSQEKQLQNLRLIEEI
jgi:hypothetical protein